MRVVRGKADDDRHQEEARERNERSTDTRAGEQWFRVLAAGQLTSMLGTSVTGVGVSIVAFLETGSVWWLSIIYLATRVPALLFSTHAGAIADRLDRRHVLLAADSVAGLATAVAVAMHLGGVLQLWHLVALALIGSVANAYQEPAFQGAVPMLVPSDRLDRANGLLQLGPAIGMLAGPALAGALVAWAGIGGVLALDLVTFVVALTSTLLVSIPPTDGEPAPQISTWAGVRASWAHLDGQFVGLRRLLVANTVANLVLSVVNVLLLALLIPLAGEDGTGVLLSMGGLVMLGTSTLVSAVGLPVRRIPVLGGALAVLGVGLVLIGLRADVVLVSIGVFVTLGVAPVIGAASQTLYQATIEAAWQGRIAALRRVASEALVPIGVLVAAPLVETVAEPAMQEGGSLASTFGRVLGVGPQRGVGLVVVTAGLVLVVVGVVVARDRRANDIDDLVIEKMADAAAGRAVNDHHRVASP